MDYSLALKPLIHATAWVEGAGWPKETDDKPPAPWKFWFTLSLYFPDPFFMSLVPVPCVRSSSQRRDTGVTRDAERCSSNCVAP
jgi:hypothetical protein